MPKKMLSDLVDILPLRDLQEGVMILLSARALNEPEDEWVKRCVLVRNIGTGLPENRELHRP